MNIDFKGLGRKAWHALSWFILTYLRSLPSRYVTYKKQYIHKMWVNYKMPTLQEAGGKYLLLLKKIAQKLIEEHFESRMFPWWTFLCADLSNAILIILGFINHERLWNYFLSFIPDGRERMFFIALPIAYWIAIELMQSKWGFDFFWFIYWRTGDVGENHWYTLKPVVVTTISRIIKSAWILFSTWAVFQAIDPRLGDITAQTFLFYWPLIVITSGMYCLEGMSFHIRLMLNSPAGWVKMFIAAVGLLDIYQIFKIAIRIPMPQWKEAWTTTKGTVEISITEFDWTGMFLDIWHHIVYYGPRFLLVGLFLYGMYRAFATFIEANASLRDSDWEEFVGKIFMGLCLTPTITFALIWLSIGYGWYTKIYLPDQIVAQQATAVVQIVEPTLAPAPEFTLTPAFTVTSMLPTETLTAIPATQTLTSTPAPFTATVSQTPVITSTSTQTLVPSPTATEAASTVDPNAPQVAVTQDMTLPIPVSKDALVQNCLGAHQGADYLLNVDPDNAYCIQGLTSYNAAGARYKVNGKDYIIIFVVADNAARYYLSGDIPDTAVCTVNGVTFNGGTYHYVDLTNGNNNSRLSCTFDDLTITATGWSFK